MTSNEHHHPLDLHTVCMSPDPDLAHLLLSLGADVNARDTYGATPLLLACIDGRPDIVRLFIKHGADVNAKSKPGDTPLHWACLHGHTSTARLLLDHGADVNAKDKEGNTPLDVASCTYRNREEIFDLFREYDAESRLFDNKRR